MDDLKTKYVTVDEAANLANRKTSLIRTLCREGRTLGISEQSVIRKLYRSIAVARRGLNLNLSLSVAS